MESSDSGLILRRRERKRAGRCQSGYNYMVLGVTSAVAKFNHYTCLCSGYGVCVGRRGGPCCKMAQNACPSRNPGEQPQ